MLKYGYKLMRVLKNGDVTSLFINKQKRITLGEWMSAENHPTKGFAVRPGFHVLCKPSAPHLSKKNRAWFLVEIDDYETFTRPENQGGKWLLAKKMKVLKALDQEVVALLENSPS